MNSAYKGPVYVGDYLEWLHTDRKIFFFSFDLKAKEFTYKDKLNGRLVERFDSLALRGFNVLDQEGNSFVIKTKKRDFQLRAESTKCFWRWFRICHFYFHKLDIFNPFNRNYDTMLELFGDSNDTLMRDTEDRRAATTIRDTEISMNYDFKFKKSHFYKPNDNPRQGKVYEFDPEDKIEEDSKQTQVYKCDLAKLNIVQDIDNETLRRKFDKIISLEELERLRKERESKELEPQNAEESNKSEILSEKPDTKEEKHFKHIISNVLNKDTLGGIDLRPKSPKKTIVLDDTEFANVELDMLKVSYPKKQARVNSKPVGGLDRQKEIERQLQLEEIERRRSIVMKRQSMQEKNYSYNLGFTSYSLNSQTNSFLSEAKEQRVPLNNNIEIVGLQRDEFNENSINIGKFIPQEDSVIGDSQRNKDLLSKDASKVNKSRLNDRQMELVSKFNKNRRIEDSILHTNNTLDALKSNTTSNIKDDDIVQQDMYNETIEKHEKPKLENLLIIPTRSIKPQIEKALSKQNPTSAQPKESIQEQNTVEMPLSLHFDEFNQQLGHQDYQTAVKQNTKAQSESPITSKINIKRKIFGSSRKPDNSYTPPPISDDFSFSIGKIIRRDEAEGQPEPKHKEPDQAVDDTQSIGSEFKEDSLYIIARQTEDSGFKAAWPMGKNNR